MENIILSQYLHYYTIYTYTIYSFFRGFAYLSRMLIFLTDLKHSYMLRKLAVYEVNYKEFPPSVLCLLTFLW